MADNNNKIELITKVSPCRKLPVFGVVPLSDDSISVTVYRPKAVSCRLNLYSHGHLIQHISLPSLKKDGMSDIFAATLTGADLLHNLSDVTYDFVSDSEHFIDPYSVSISGRDHFGRTSSRIRAGFDFDDFDWTGEKKKLIPTDKMVMYECHVRGFTRHSSSGVTHPGTFDGIRQKIPYLKKLGVNSLFLLPIYDFDETDIPAGSDGKKRLNYWGYTGSAYHFAPKASYSSDPAHPGRELKTLVKELHKAGMNIYLDMYFVEQTLTYVLRCLRYYASEFHIDGFRINPDAVHLRDLRSDPVLNHIRFINYSWDGVDTSDADGKLFTMNDNFKNTARRYVKSDEGQVEGFYYGFRAQSPSVATINHITGHNGFTLRDLISYDIKHNDANGERGLDGTEYNYSWNCGFEGTTSRKAVLRMRAKQEKNILVMLLLGLPIPLILAGDEFGNSQKGNNNAYCIDGPVTWLNWNLLDKNRETYDYIRKLLALRETLSLYHKSDIYTGFDNKGAGAPDISAHGREPWNNMYQYYSRELGILFYGPYLDETPVTSYYFAFNMHWESHAFYLPDITKSRNWKVVLDTAEDIRTTPGLNTDRTAYTLEPRSIVILSCEEDKPVKKNKQRKTEERSAMSTAKKPGTKRKSSKK